MSSSMVSMVKSGVSGVREGADAVTHTLGEVFDDVKARVEDLVDLAHPKQIVVKRRRRRGPIVLVLVLVGGLAAWKLITRNRGAEPSRHTSVTGHASDADAGVRHDAPVDLPV